jgi:hypothetical protein
MKKYEYEKVSEALFLWFTNHAYHRPDPATESSDFPKGM